ncbi:Hypothetical protein NTJ_11251 [Nesidiocoris tenuis]|uniref:Uncharacterized protein n=1 Tax=Nesidiocoris tenuis TaxID=355587 RepID=A0ABN7B1Y9_9HEMI|nr:Hypothetical protein NTJ_11251 [Nesidiocoris tenuis]
MNGQNAGKNPEVFEVEGEARRSYEVTELFIREEVPRDRLCCWCSQGVNYAKDKVVPELAEVGGFGTGAQGYTDQWRLIAMPLPLARC